MNVLTRASFDAQLPTAIFLCKEALADVQQLSEVMWSKWVSETHSAIDEFTLWHTPDIKVIVVGLGEGGSLSLEKFRRVLHKVVTRVADLKWEAVQLYLPSPTFLPIADDLFQAMGEVPILSLYQFLTYRTDREKLNHKLHEIAVVAADSDAQHAVEKGTKVAGAVCLARDLVNEPPNVLTATELARRAEVTAAQFGFKAEVLTKPQIEALKMGGLLGVNRGSLTPPTFTVLEYKPEKYRNAKPVILVGKGIVFDTGGLSLKPTPGGMDTMKCDMAGAAAVVGTMAAVAALQVPVHVVGLIPATDNRPGQDAYTPNDVLTLHDGTTVEVLNTDAEGRLILADALAYAKRYTPALVIDLATLTGAAVIAVGPYGIAAMRTCSDENFQMLHTSGQRTHERVVELPLWDEYSDLLKSEVADLKNIGGRAGGSITAGKFLQRFTDYPWVHLDIAAPAFLDASYHYWGKQGTGVGVRLLTDFLSHYA